MAWNDDQVRWGREVPWHEFGPAPGRWAPGDIPLTPGGKHARWGTDIARRVWNTGARRLAQENWARRLARRVGVKRVKDRRTGPQIAQALRPNPAKPDAQPKVQWPSPNPKDHAPEALEAQAAHFNAGGTIEGAPVAGLWNYIQATPERFEVKRTGGDIGISPNWTVIDRVTGEIWFAKGDPGLAFPEVKEVLAAEIMRAAGFVMPVTRLGQAGGREGKMGDSKNVVMLQRDWTQTAYGGSFGELGARLTNAAHKGGGKRLGEQLARGNDPGALARMVVFDYLIDNAIDRHSANVMLVDNPPGAQPGGLDLAVLDHGLAFGGWGADPPRFKDFQEFFDRYRGTSWDYQDALDATTGGDRDELRRYVMEAFEEFSRVKPAEIRRAMKLAGAPEDLVDKYVHAFEERQRHLADADAVDRIMAAWHLGASVALPQRPVKKAAKKAAPKAHNLQGHNLQGVAAAMAAQQRRGAA